MIYTAIDTFYLADEQLENSPSKKDNIDEATETTLRIYGCDLIQESGILLRLYHFLPFSFTWDYNFCICFLVCLICSYYYYYFYVVIGLKL